MSHNFKTTLVNLFIYLSNRAPSPLILTRVVIIRVVKASGSYLHGLARFIVTL